MHRRACSAETRVALARSALRCAAFLVRGPGGAGCHTQLPVAREEAAGIGDGGRCMCALSSISYDHEYILGSFARPLATFCAGEAARHLRHDAHASVRASASAQIGGMGWGMDA
eukprot:6105116-Pleurochrysis_carterae.AAC.2